MYSGRGLCRMGEFSWTKEFVASLQEYKAPFYTDLIKDYNIIRRVPLYFHKRILDIFRSTRDHCLRFCVHRTGRLITDQVVIKVKDKRWVCQQCLFAHISSKKIFNNKITKKIRWRRQNGFKAHSLLMLFGVNHYFKDSITLVCQIQIKPGSSNSESHISCKLLLHWFHQLGGNRTGGVRVRVKVKVTSQVCPMSLREFQYMSISKLIQNYFLHMSASTPFHLFIIVFLQSGSDLLWHYCCLTRPPSALNGIRHIWCLSSTTTQTKVYFIHIML